MSADKRFYALIHPGGPGGLVLEKPEMREQDEKFESDDFYAVVFFPKITGIGNACLHYTALTETLANSPEAARVKFMDRIAKKEKWETYVDAGHKIRRIQIIDLGDATSDSGDER